MTKQLRHLAAPLARVAAINGPANAGVALNVANIDQELAFYIRELT